MGPRDFRHPSPPLEGLALASHLETGFKRDGGGEGEYEEDESEVKQEDAASESGLH
jgi:hypothetical protein